MNVGGRFCFHCGDALTAEPVLAMVESAARPCCCTGCAAVAESIDAAGLADYYRLRSAPAPRAESPALPSESFDGPAYRAAVRTCDDEDSVRLALDGVRCPACLWLIGERLRSLPGILGAEVDYASQTARVRWPRGNARLGRAIAAVETLGYRGRPCGSGQLDAAVRAGRHRNGVRLIFAIVVGMTVMNGAAAIYLAGTAPPQLWERVVCWTSALLCLPLMAWSGADFFVGAWRDARNRRVGMDVPVALGLVVAWVGSLPGLLEGGPVYFDSIAMLVAAVLAARWFEQRARVRAAAALDRLAVIEPLIAHRQRPEGGEDNVPAPDLRPGDRVRVSPGEIVPADGKLLSSCALLNEAMLTGEPFPVRRRQGEDVHAGAVNLESAFTLSVTAVGELSTLGELHRLLERGLASRPRVAETADRLAAPLVSIVLAGAALTWLAWQWIDPARALPATIAVLIVTCPCALALATPLTLSLAAGRFAAAGLVPLRMAALDALATARIAVFDKTGTLTSGRARLAELRTWGGLAERDALDIAAALEGESLHPIASALREAAPGAAHAQSLSSSPGAGVSGEAAGQAWRLGSHDHVGTVPDEASRAAARWQAEGALVALLSNGADRAAGFAIADQARAGIDGLGETLRGLGLARLVCLSGDAGADVARVANLAGCDEWIAGCTPHDKLAWVQRQQADGHLVLMVGDGLNDAATLAAADASISFADAPRLSRSAADWLITGESLAAVPRARRIARFARAVLRQNLAWAAAYNLLAVPLAAGGLVTPWWAAFGMAASSTVVVANALRINRAT